MKIFTKEITVEDVYGSESPTVPQGYEAVDFRLPLRGESYLFSNVISIAVIDHAFFGVTNGPRLILQPIKPAKRWVYEECSWEDATARINPDYYSGWRLVRRKDGTVEYEPKGYVKYVEGDSWVRKVEE